MTSDIFEPCEEKGLKYLLRILAGGFNLTTNPFACLPADLRRCFNCLQHAKARGLRKKYT